MSEFQYYEFLAVDRPLDEAAQRALRAISSRARITATSFANHYEWGDLKGDPNRFMEQWFDLHLYLANWGTRRLMMRVPLRFLAPGDLTGFVDDVDWADVRTFGEDAIVDLYRDDEPDDDWDGEDDADWLAALAPLRADLLAGDLRLFYLVWLSAVQDETVADEALEPMAGVGPLTPALEAFMEFFRIDCDLVQAAAEAGARVPAASADGLRTAIAGIDEMEKTELLLRLVQSDPHVAAELRRRFRQAGRIDAVHRSAGELRRRAAEIAAAREQAAAELREAERRRKAEEQEREIRQRRAALKARGAAVWNEIESEIARRNAYGYDRAASLLRDLEALAIEEGSRESFLRRLSDIRQTHAAKGRFIERLAGIGDDGFMVSTGLVILSETR